MACPCWPVLLDTSANLQSSLLTGVPVRTVAPVAVMGASQGLTGQKHAMSVWSCRCERENLMKAVRVEHVRTCASSQLRPTQPAASPTATGMQVK